MPTPQAWDRSVPWNEQLASSHNIDSILPPDYDVYLRVFHPFVPWKAKVNEPVPAGQRVRWATLAKKADGWFGPGISWAELAPVLPASPEGRPLAVWEGDLEITTRDALYSTIDDGPGPFNIAFGLAGIVRGRDHASLMFIEPSLSAIGKTAKAIPVLGQDAITTPEYVWPEDRRWIVCSDYDLASTYVAASREIASQLFANETLEILELSPSDRLL